MKKRCVKQFKSCQKHKHHKIVNISLPCFLCIYERASFSINNVIASYIFIRHCLTFGMINKYKKAKLIWNQYRQKSAFTDCADLELGCIVVKSNYSSLSYTNFLINMGREFVTGTSVSSGSFGVSVAILLTEFVWTCQTASR